MNHHQSIFRKWSKWPWILAVVLAFVVGIAGLALWFGNVIPLGRDPLFRGKPQSEWIKNLKYNNDRQVKEWREYGEEGVQVLICGLERADPAGQQAYRRLIRRLPELLGQCLPAPKPDSTQVIRQCVVSLLSSLSKDAKSATPILIRTARNDVSDAVRQGAIGYFISSQSLLEQLSRSEKKALLPALIDAMQQSGNWGLKDNAAIVLKYFPEYREVAAPVLVMALQHAQPQVRMSAAESLNRVAPDAAKKAGATEMLIALTKDPDDQIASKAAAALGHAGSQPDLAVPALIECLQSTNTLVACDAVWALEWAPEEFHAYSDTVIPALTRANERKDNVGGYARVALAKWQSMANAKPGTN